MLNEPLLIRAELKFLVHLRDSRYTWFVIIATQKIIWNRLLTLANLLSSTKTRSKFVYVTINKPLVTFAYACMMHHRSTWSKYCFQNLYYDAYSDKKFFNNLNRINVIYQTMMLFNKRSTLDNKTRVYTFPQQKR